ncbi:MAG: hypothetical protein SPL42_05375 [Bacteroidales bacterium]|nr:hypothetical protein [Bacteroidales bacterium]MDY6347845.1 hypothetical protein [Bacteroidales bacterium]
MIETKPTYKKQGSITLFDNEEEKKRKANKKRQKDTDARWVKKGGLQHLDKPGLQPVPVRASITSRDELTN